MPSHTTAETIRIRAILAAGAGTVAFVALVEIPWLGGAWGTATILRLTHAVVLAGAAALLPADRERAHRTLLAAIVAGQILTAVASATNQTDNPLVVFLLTATTGCVVAVAVITEMPLRFVAVAALTGSVAAPAALLADARAEPVMHLLGSTAAFAAAAAAVTIRFRLDRAERRSAQLEAEQRAVARQLEMFVENAAELVQRTDAAARIVYANPAWLAALGYSWPEVELRPIGDFLHPADRERLRVAFAGRPGGPPVDQLECRFVARDGRTVWAEGSVVPPRADAADATTLGVFHDVSQRVTDAAGLRRAQGFLQRLIDAVPTRIAVLDEDMHVLQTNQAWQAPDPAAAADPLQALRAGDDLPARVDAAAATAPYLHPAAELLHAARRNPALPGAVLFEAVAADGAPLWWRLEIASFLFGDRLHFVLTLTDLTAIRRAEEAILATQARFERAVGAAQQGILEWDLPRSEIYYGPALLDLLGLTAATLRERLEAWVRSLPGLAATAAARAIEFRMEGEIFCIRVRGGIPAPFRGEQPIGIGFWQTIVHPDDQEELRAAALRHFAGAAPYIDHEFRALHASGQYRWFHLRGRGEFAAGGELQRLTVSLHDVTDRREATEALAAVAGELQAMVRTAPLGIVSIDDGGTITGFNPAAAELFRIAPEAALGRPVDELAPPAARRGLRDFVSAMFAQPAGSSVGGEVVLHTSDGSAVDAEVVAFLGHGHGGRRVHAFLRDIGAQKRAARLKDEMISTLSHELRTPLTSLRGFAELLSQQEFGREQQQRYLGIILKESERMTRLINAMLDMRRAQRGLHAGLLRPVALDRIVAAAIERLPADWRRQRPIALECEADLPEVAGDADALGRVFDNVLANACRYSAPAAGIAVDLRRVGDRVQCIVRDEGIGIPDRDRDRLFDEFFRGDSAQVLAADGVGLGLALCRKVLEAHGGEIAVAGGDGGGTTVTIRMPITARQPA